jgi:signal transduction histidine kinase
VLTNTARLAEAGLVTIQFVTTPEQVRLTVEDDGRGFDAYEISAGHHGLVGMNERAKMLGDSFDVQSSRGIRHPDSSNGRIREALKMEQSAKIRILMGPITTRYCVRAS